MGEVGDIIGTHSIPEVNWVVDSTLVLRVWFKKDWFMLQNAE